MVMYSGIKQVFSDKPFALIFDLSPSFRTTLIEIAAVCTMRLEEKLLSSNHKTASFEIEYNKLLKITR